MNKLAIVFLVLSAVVCSVFSRAIRVTCIGDSITEGGGQCNNGSYTTYLQTILGSGYVVTNAGVSAMTQLKKGQCNGGGDCSYWHTDAWQMALSSSPDIVTIMLGTNDAKAFNWESVQQSEGDYFTLDYVDMIQQLKKTSKRQPKIYLMIPPPLYQPYPFEMNATIINSIFPTLIPDLASVTKSEVIDIYTAIKSWDASEAEKSCDGCHPTDEGQVIIAKTIAAAITGSVTN